MFTYRLRPTSMETGMSIPPVNDAYCIGPIPPIYFHKIDKFPPISEKYIHFPLFPQNFYISRISAEFTFFA